MATFPQHTLESAPVASRSILQGAQNALGFIPNLYAHLAESPEALRAYTTLANIFEKSTLSPEEQQVVLLAISVYHGCEFCVSAHSLIAKKQIKVDSEIVSALRDARELPDARLDSLAVFARKVADQRGWVDQDEIETFLAAGFTHANAIDVIVGVSLKTISNYTNHLTNTQVNPEFGRELWRRPNSSAA